VLHGPKLGAGRLEKAQSEHEKQGQINTIRIKFDKSQSAKYVNRAKGHFHKHVKRRRLRPQSYKNDLMERCYYGVGQSIFFHNTKDDKENIPQKKKQSKENTDSIKTHVDQNNPGRKRWLTGMGNK